MKRLPLVLMLVFVLAACKSDSPRISFDDLPEGNPESGAQLFLQSVNDAPACSECHELTTVNGKAPGMSGYGARAGSRVDGENAREYTFHSIVQPPRHVVSGFSNVMYNDYDKKLTPQDIADLIAFLLEQ